MRNTRNGLLFVGAKGADFVHPSLAKMNSLSYYINKLLSDLSQTFPDCSLLKTRRHM